MMKYRGESGQSKMYIRERRQESGGERDSERLRKNTRKETETQRNM